MTTENQDFTMWAGDYKALRFLVTGITDPADVSAAEFKMTRVDEGTNTISKTLANGGITKGAAVGGVYLTVLLLEADTEDEHGFYHHELEVTDTSNHAQTVASGHATVRSALT